MSNQAPRHPSSEDEQISMIVAAAKSGGDRIGVFIDDYKEAKFMGALRSHLPASEFEISLEDGITPGTKVIFIARTRTIDVSRN